MKAKVFLLKSIRKTYRLVTRPNFCALCDYSRERANERIFEMLSMDIPCMVSRLGTGEAGVLSNYLSVHREQPILSKCINYIVDEVGLPWWDSLFLKSMKRNMGVFPESFEVLEKFSRRYLDDIPEIDLLGAMNYSERYMPLSKDVDRVNLECLYPFFVNQPWTKALAGKRVLVIHPFAKSINQQYKRRGLLFDNTDILPEYQLITYPAIQSNADAIVPFSDWFEALRKMENDIDNIEYDIAIIGCGAYGLPLAAHIKRNGKKAIHIGGGTQLLFGIKGKRWDNNYHPYFNVGGLNTNYGSLYNEFWIRPSAEETPNNASSVEDACYW